MRLLAQAILLFRKTRKKVLSLFFKPLFKKCGKNVVFDPDDLFSFRTIEIGNDVFIGGGAKFVASESSIVIGNKVMFGPNVSIVGGNHNIKTIGRFLFDVKEKRPQDDQPVIVEDDVWVGTNVTILKGVRVGRGSVVGAGAVVTRDIPSYSIVMGVPAKVSKFRFGIDQIIDHEKSLYLESERISRNTLVDLFRHYEIGAGH